MLKKILYWAVFVGFIWFLYSNYSSLEQIFTTLDEGNYMLFALTIPLELLVLFSLANMYRLVFDLAGVKVTTWNMFKSTFIMSFFNVANPLGSWVSMGVIAKRAVGNTKMNLTSGYFVLALAHSIFNLVSFSGMLVTLVYLYQNEYDGFAIILTSVIVYVAFNLITPIAMLSASRRPIVTKKIAFWFKNFIGTFGGLKSISVLKGYGDDLDRAITEFSINSKIILENINAKGAFLRILFWGIIANAAGFMMLWMTFIAFGVDVPFMHILTTDSITYLYSTVSPTPYGIGFVEGISQLAMVELGMDATDGFVVPLMYRAIYIWMPIFIGALIFRAEGFDRHGDMGSRSPLTNS